MEARQQRRRVNPRRFTIEWLSLALRRCRVVTSGMDRLPTRLQLPRRSRRSRPTRQAVSGKRDFSPWLKLELELSTHRDCEIARWDWSGGGVDGALLGLASVLILSGPILSYPILSCPVLSCPAAGAIIPIPSHVGRKAVWAKQAFS